MDEAWYIAVTRAQAEMRVTEALRDLDVTTRCYRVKRRSVLHGVVTEKLLPAYRGYVFTYANADWYRPIKDVKGVINFLSLHHDGYPTPISSWEIERLDALSDSAFVFGTYDPRDRYSRGDKIRVLSGPFAYFTAHFRELVRNMAICEVDMMGRKVPVTLGLHQIEMTTPATVEIKPRKNRKRRAERRLLEEQRLMT